MKIIGITGPTGSGKTTALNVLEEFGARIIDCDAEYHVLLENSVELRDELVKRFGDIAPDGKIDRKKLGSIVFNDRNELDALNGITARFTDKAVTDIIKSHAEAGGELAAIDAIALIECGLGRRCDLVVGILALKEVRAERIMLREGITFEYAMSRIESQQQDEFYRENCDVILENYGTKEEFELLCREFFTKYLDKGED